MTVAIANFTFAQTLEIRSMAMSQDKAADLLRYIYNSTYIQMGPWFAGMFLGCILHKTWGRKVKIKPILVTPRVLKRLEVLNNAYRKLNFFKLKLIFMIKFIKKRKKKL